MERILEKLYGQYYRKGKISKDEIAKVFDLSVSQIENKIDKMRLAKKYPYEDVLNERYYRELLKKIGGEKIEKI